MIASSAGRNRSFWRSSRGLATASPNADDPPPNRTNRPKRESQIARNQRLAAVFPRNRLLLSPRFAKRLNAHAILHGRLVIFDQMVPTTDRGSATRTIIQMPYPPSIKLPQVP